MSEGWFTQEPQGRRSPVQPIPWASGLDGTPPDATTSGASGPCSVENVRPAIHITVESADQGIVAAVMAAAQLDPGIRIIRISHAGALRANGEQDADVSIVDIALRSRIDALRRSASDVPARHGRHLLVMNCHEANAAEVLKSTRAHGCVSHDVAPVQLARAVRAVAQGGLWIPRRVLDEAYLHHVSSNGIDVHPGAALSQREQQVFEMARTGLTNKEIARRLGISISTVKKHLHAALDKYGLHRRRQLLP